MNVSTLKGMFLLIISVYENIDFPLDGMEEEIVIVE
jgi:hypothetical protein